MKNLLILLLLCLTIWLISCGGDENPIVESPTQNTDSIRCAQKWQQFQLSNDTILTLRYQQPVKIGNGSDTMAVTVINIDDRCSAESARDIYGCDARIHLKTQLNGDCVYQTKYPLDIARYGNGTGGLSFTNFPCRVGSDNADIWNAPSSILGFYNLAIRFQGLIPFAKTQVELLQLNTNKGDYIVTLWLKKRCF